jgi:site-specific DNA recombinase
LIYDLQTKKNIKIISLKEKDLNSTDPTRVLMRQILGSFSQYEKSLITMRLKLGRLNKVRKGGFGGGRPAFGYSSIDKELTIDDNNSEIVKQIFYLKRYKRMSMNAIAEKLNRENVPSANGGKWYARTIKNILERRTYTKGEIVYKNIKTQKCELALL